MAHRRPRVAARGRRTSRAPLYVAWQITNECNLACLHCIEESGPGKAFADELDRDAGLRRPRPADATARSRTCRSRAASRCSIRTSSRWSSASARAARSSRSRPTATTSTPENCARAEGARRQGGAGEPRRRVARDLQPDARARRVRPRRRRRAQPARRPACRSRSTSRRRASTSTRSAPSVDLAYELGAYSFYTGRTMYTGNAVKAWRHLDVDRGAVRRVLRHAAREGRASTAAACASTSTRRGCSRSCATACSTRRRC